MLHRSDILRLEGGGPKNIPLRRAYNRQMRQRRWLQGGGWWDNFQRLFTNSDAYLKEVALKKMGDELRDCKDSDDYGQLLSKLYLQCEEALQASAVVRKYVQMRMGYPTLSGEDFRNNIDNTDDQAILEAYDGLMREKKEAAKQFMMGCVGAAMGTATALAYDWVYRDWAQAANGECAVEPNATYVHEFGTTNPTVPTVPTPVPAPVPSYATTAWRTVVSGAFRLGGGDEQSNKAKFYAKMMVLDDDDEWSEKNLEELETVICGAYVEYLSDEDEPINSTPSFDEEESAEERRVRFSECTIDSECPENSVCETKNNVCKEVMTLEEFSDSEDSDNDTEELEESETESAAESESAAVKIQSGVRGRQARQAAMMRERARQEAAEMAMQEEEQRARQAEEMARQEEERAHQEEMPFVIEINEGKCRCTTKKGLQCKRSPIKGKQYCYQHRNCENFWG